MGIITYVTINSPTKGGILYGSGKAKIKEKETREGTTKNSKDNGKTSQGKVY